MSKNAHVAPIASPEFQKFIEETFMQFPSFSSFGHSIRFFSIPIPANFLKRGYLESIEAYICRLAKEKPYNLIEIGQIIEYAKLRDLERHIKYSAWCYAFFFERTLSPYDKIPRGFSDWSKKIFKFEVEGDLDDEFRWQILLENRRNCVHLPYLYENEKTQDYVLKAACYNIRGLFCIGEIIARNSSVYSELLKSSPYGFLFFGQTNEHLRNIFSSHENDVPSQDLCNGSHRHATAVLPQTETQLDVSRDLKKLTQDSNFAVWVKQVFAEGSVLSPLGFSPEFAKIIDMQARLPKRKKDHTLAEYICFVAKMHPSGLVAVGDIVLIEKLTRFEEILRSSPYDWLFFDNNRQIPFPKTPTKDFVEFALRKEFFRDVFVDCMKDATNRIDISRLPLMFSSESFADYLIRVYRFHTETLFLIGDVFNFANQFQKCSWEPFNDLFDRTIQHPPSEEGPKIEVKQIRSDEQKSECVVCFEPIAIRFVLIPCGHTTICQKCIPDLKSTCPVCRTEIVSHLQIYL